MRSHQAALFCVASLLLVGFALAESREEEQAKAWVVRPKLPAEIPAADEAARQAFLKLIEWNETEEFRKTMRVVVPKHGTGLPEAYELLLYGKYIDAQSADVLRVTVKEGKATAQWANWEGIRTGELPFEEVDLLARQLAYGFLTRVEPKDELNFHLDMGMYASHVPYHTVELASQRRPVLFHLRTAAYQAIYDEITDHSYDVRGFIHTHTASKLHKAARERLAFLSAEDQKRETLARLKRISVDKRPGRHDPEPLPVMHYERGDLAGVEAPLFAHLAVEQAVAEALPELRRLGASEYIAKLEIAAAVDPLPGLAKALRGEDWQVFKWALDFADRDDPKFVQLLVEQLPLVSRSRIENILRTLGDCKLTAEQTHIIETLFQESPADLPRVKLAGFLLRQTQEDRYFDALLEVARGPEKDDKQTVYSPKRHASGAVFDFAGRTNIRRKEAYDLLKSQLAVVRADRAEESTTLHYLLVCLGRLGTREDLPILEKHAENESGYIAQAAIHSIARIDPELAVKKARQRIEAYAEEGGASNVYSWNVPTYFPLLFWQNDRASVESLRQAYSRLDAKDQERGGEYWNPRLLIDYLQAQGTPARVKAALAYTKDRHIEPAWLKAVGEELAAAGGDREDLKPLLEPPAPRRWR